MTVSCADIIALATRDSVALAGGSRYSIPTGRRDGLVSNPAEVNLPGPSLTVQEALKFFTNKGFSLNDMVTLLGAHTVGIAHCSLFQDRISRSDGSMDPNLFARLSRTCAARNDPSVFLDQSTSFIVDNEFYKQIRLKKGILKIDQQLATDRSTAGVVNNFSINLKAFQQAFANALIKLGNTQVLEGRLGEIRQNCRAFNPPQRKQRQPRKNFRPKKPKNPPPRKGPEFSIPFLAP